MKLAKAAFIAPLCVLVILCSFKALGKSGDGWGDDDEKDDEFWKDPPPSADGPVINNQKLFKPFNKQLDVKLRPDPERTEADARELAKEWESDLEDLKSEDTVAPNNKDSIHIKSRGDFEETKKWIFSQPEAYEIIDITNLGSGGPPERFRRPGDTKPWSELKREVYNEGPAPPKPAGGPTLDQILGLKKKLKKKGKRKPKPVHPEL